MVPCEKQVHLRIVLKIVLIMEIMHFFKEYT